ncbi:transcriptional regulator PerR [Vallitalea okinawensis]|uniref:Fur family transcriptional regulator n=1 Tax=Vallitalea okinawensis TaxID=2078660 RepID=UPI000CFC9EA4|nr:Fur family transcriptional regulator [Vallitalea okinawensis]
MQKLAELLKAKKLKVTPQRLAIFNMLYNTTSHPSAETIYKSLQETHPTMSLATVYKTLDALQKAGLIQQLNVGEDSFRYDANVSSHPHVICLECNRVFDLESDILNDLRSKVASNTDFDLISEKVYLYGTCPECKESMKEE